MNKANNFRNLLLVSVSAIVATPFIAHNANAAIACPPAPIIANTPIAGTIDLARGAELENIAGNIISNSIGAPIKIDASLCNSGMVKISNSGQIRNTTPKGTGINLNAAAITYNSASSDPIGDVTINNPGLITSFGHAILLLPPSDDLASSITINNGVENSDTSANPGTGRISGNGNWLLDGVLRSGFSIVTGTPNGSSGVATINNNGYVAGTTNGGIYGNIAMYGNSILNNNGQISGNINYSGDNFELTLNADHSKILGQIFLRPSDPNALNSNLVLNLNDLNNVGGTIYGHVSDTSNRNWVHFDANGEGQSFSTVNVNSGNWTLIGSGLYDNVNIASGANFTVCAMANICKTDTGEIATDSGISGISDRGLDISNNGILNYQTDAVNLAYDGVDPFRITGNGTTNLVGDTRTSLFFNKDVHISQSQLNLIDFNLYLGTLVNANVHVDAGSGLFLGTEMKDADGNLIQDAFDGDVNGIIELDGRRSDGWIGAMVIRKKSDFTLNAKVIGAGEIQNWSDGTVTIANTADFRGDIALAKGNVILNADSGFESDRFYNILLSPAAGDAKFTNLGNLEHTRALNPIQTLTSFNLQYNNYGAIYGVGFANRKIEIENSGNISSANGAAIAILTPKSADNVTAIINNNGVLNGGIGSFIYGGKTFQNAQQGMGVFILGVGGNSTYEVTNSGTINGDVAATGVAKLVTLNNSGTINGNVSLFAPKSEMNLYGGTITGKVTIGADAIATLNLNGNGGTIHGYLDNGGAQDWVRDGGETGFNDVNVNSGTWILVGQGLYDNLKIANGATFISCDNDACRQGTGAESGGFGPRSNSINIINDGNFIYNSFDANLYNDPNAPGLFKYSGTGTWEFTGGGRAYLGSMFDINSTGNIKVGDYHLYIGANQTANFDIAADGILEIGTGGSEKDSDGALLDDGKSGNITGNVVVGGSLIFNRLDDFTFNGNISGDGKIIKRNGNIVTLGGTYDYSGATQILAGSINLGANAKLSETSPIIIDGGTLNIGNTDQVIGGLESSNSQSSLNLGTGEESGTLKIVQNSDSAFDGQIEGSGEITKTGEGDLILNGDSTGFSGDLIITNGLIEIGDADNPNAVLGDGSVEVIVGAQGALGGHGTIEGNVNNGGSTVPGGSIGTLAVSGNYQFAKGGLLEAEVAANGAHDLLQIGGTTTINSGANAIVQIIDPITSYSRLQNVVLIDGAGGINGQFGAVTTDNNVIKAYSNYANGKFSVTLLRTDISLATLAQTANQKSSAAAINELGAGNKIYDAIALTNSDSISSAADSTSGEIYADLQSSLFQSQNSVTDAAMRNSGEKGLWANFESNEAKFSSNGNYATSKSRSNQYLLGYNYQQKLAGIGAFFGHSEDKTIVQKLNSSAKGNSQIFGINLNAQLGKFAFDAIASHIDAKSGINRGVAIGALSGNAIGKSRFKSDNSTAKISYEFGNENWKVSPFLAAANTKISGFNIGETGTDLGLDVKTESRNIKTAQYGIELDADLAFLGLKLRPFAQYYHQTNSGDISSFANSTINKTASFDIEGVGIAKDENHINLGLGMSFGNNFKLSVNYMAIDAKSNKNTGFGLNANCRF